MRLLKHLLCCFLLLPSFASAQGFKDVREMGDIWIVTIDNSGSMLTERQGDRITRKTSSDIANNVYNRLINGGSLETAIFENDRFLFLTSGYNYSTDIGLGNELRRSAPFDRSFIHQTDGILHSFKSKRECAAHIRSLIMNNKYENPLSFVSQIRVFSIVRGVNDLKRNGVSNSFYGLKVLTITDDADQNDQWMMDYRNLKSWAPSKVQEVNDSTSKYIYNILNGKGNGNLEELFSDEKSIPHIWVYQYLSKEQEVSLSQMNLFDVKAADGSSFSVESQTNHINGNIISFFHIDSIIINQKVFEVKSSFKDGFSVNCKYDNALRRNKISIWGFAQVTYNDSIFGEHQKVVPFVQNETACSEKLTMLISVSIGIFIFSLVALLLFLLIIRPNLRLFSIHSGLGNIATVKRGFASHWKGEYIPTQCYQSDARGIFGVITKKDRIIRVIPSVVNENRGEILICSHFKLGISVDAICHSTADDIENYYNSRTDDYSFLLRNQYEKTVFFKLYRRCLYAKWKWVTYIYRFLISFFNFFGKHYYYIIKNLDKCNKVYVSIDNLLFGKRFVIEYYDTTSCGLQSEYDMMTRNALTYYYNSSKNKYDIILCGISVKESVFWIAIQLDDLLLSHDSLRSVKSVLRFEQTDDIDEKEHISKVILSSLGKEFPRKHIGYFDITQRLSDANETPLSFAISQSTAPGYISFVEATERARVQPLYSPIQDADTKELFIMPQRRIADGHIYLSAIPITELKTDKSLMKQLSQNVVKFEDRQPCLLKLKENGFEFRNIKEEY